jgi:hypothetical protein
MQVPSCITFLCCQRRALAQMMMVEIMMIGWPVGWLVGARALGFAVPVLCTLLDEQHEGSLHC